MNFTAILLGLKGKLAPIAALPFAFLLGSAHSTSLDDLQPQFAPEIVQLKLASVPSGEPLVAEGTSAQDRNAMIPLSKQPLEGMGKWRLGDLSGPTYDNALKCMTQAIYYEAANEPVAGKRAVAQVVLNRLRHPLYPNSVCGVVYEGSNQRVCQFSFTCDGSLLRRPMASKWQASRDVAIAALGGHIEKSVGTSTHYHADYVLPRWAFRLGKVTKIGAHIFYRFPGSAGRSRAFSARWAGREAIPALNWDRLKRLEADRLDGLESLEPEQNFVTGLTVVPDIKDRHAPSDVGGRIDTTKEWRLSIPDPVNTGGIYEASIAKQGGQAPDSESTLDERD
ncbi:cell wall hydrolase [Erythrobacter sp. HKB08]|uniref:cell wall hydrolase n=1 Tax=Erythrobacter sp. HKB08 TaxID=2502843 RepID=UPI0010086E4F|nr:cell wall hydrolase [Erythrobacter sp. HKB08]